MAADGAFGARSTTEDVLAGIDLSGTTAVVTGVSSGIGVETVRALAAHGAAVIATARNPGKAEQALARAGVPASAAVTIDDVDLASLTSVRAFTDRVAARHDQLQLVIANAGVMACPESRTTDGFELQFGTNHLGHFVLVNRLVPLLVAGAPGRVVCVSSSGHRLSDVDLEDPNFDTTPYEPWTAYGRSKTANVQFAVELDGRMRDRSVRACAVHPGGIETELARHLDAESRAMIEEHRRRGSDSFKSLAAGAATTVWAAVVAEAELIGGAYAEDCSVDPESEGAAPAGGRVGVAPYALDPERAALLWARSEELVGERFP